MISIKVTSKYTMVLYNFIGRCDVIDAVQPLVEKTVCKYYSDSLLALIPDFHQILCRNACK